MGVRDPARRVRMIQGLAALLLAGLLAGCGPTEGRPAAAGSEQVVVTAEPGLRFKVSNPGHTIRVRAGRPVRLVLRNRDSIQHDLWVVGPDERAPYLSPVFPGAKTPLVDPGREVAIRFTPSRPGRYRYVCAVPGHDSTMFGTFVVE